MQGRTYKYMTEEPLYPFGYGLSYSRFEYGKLELSASELPAGETISAAVTVRNAGNVDSDEVVQLYLTAEDAEFEVPFSSLVGARRISLPAGESQVVSFKIEPRQMQVFAPDGIPQFVSGTYVVRVGGVSPGKRGEDLTGSRLEKAVFELRVAPN